MSPPEQLPDPTPLGSDVDSGEPVVLPYPTRDLGVTVVGQTGYGKTTLLEQLILYDIRQGSAVIAIDAHGDLTKRILSLAEADEANLWLLEAWEDAPFRLNLFDCPDPASPIAVDRTVSGIVQVFKRLFGSPREFYPRLERDLGNAARTVLAIDGTLLDVPRLFWDAEFRAAALARVGNPRVREFWALWERISRPDRQLDQLESTINRLDQFLSSEFVAQVVGSTATTVPFDQVLAGAGRVLLVSLPVGEIGEGLCNLLGALVLAVLTERIFARARLAPTARPRVHLYLDEYGRYATPTTAQLLTEGRKFGVGTTIAHQTRAQIPDEENRAAELQVGTLICFQLIGADAAELAGEFRVSPEPQWEERVEEIEGTEPILAIAQAPVEQLLRTTHADAGVRAVVQQLLVPLQQATERQQLVPPQQLTETMVDPRWRQRALKDGLVLLDRLLVDVMEGRVDADSSALESALEERLLELLLLFRETWLLERDAYWRDRDAEAREAAVRAYRPFVAASLHLYPEQDVGAVGRGRPPVPDAQQLLADPRVTEVVDRVFEQWRSYALIPMKLKVTAGEGTARQWYEQQEWVERVSPKVREELAATVIEAAGALCQLRYLCQAVAKAPVMVPSGQERPRVRIRYITHPQRSYQDVHNELAVQLASLPRFTAYTSVHGDQHRVALGPPAAGEIDEARIARIRQESRARFGRPPEPPAPAPPATGGGPPSPIGRYHVDEPEP